MQITEIEPKSLTGKVLLQGIQALENSDRKDQRSKYPNTPQGLEDFRNKSITYLKSVLVATEEEEDAKNMIYPNVCSWCAFLNISRVTLLKYSRRGQDWLEVIEEIKAVILSVKSQLADHGKIPPMTWVFDATNNFGFYNTSEYKIDRAEQAEIRRALTVNELPKLTTEELKSKYGVLENNSEYDVSNLPD